MVVNARKDFGISAITRKDFRILGNPNFWENVDFDHDIGLNSFGPDPGQFISDTRELKVDINNWW